MDVKLSHNKCLTFCKFRQRNALYSRNSIDPLKRNRKMVFIPKYLLQLREFIGSLVPQIMMQRQYSVPQ